MKTVLITNPESLAFGHVGEVDRVDKKWNGDVAGVHVIFQNSNPFMETSAVPRQYFFFAHEFEVY